MKSLCNMFVVTPQFALAIYAHYNSDSISHGPSLIISCSCKTKS